MLTVLIGFPIHPVTRAAAYDADVETGKAQQPASAADYVRGLVIGR